MGCNTTPQPRAYKLECGHRFDMLYIPSAGRTVDQRRVGDFVWCKECDNKKRMIVEVLQVEPWKWQSVYHIKVAKRQTKYGY